MNHAQSVGPCGSATALADAQTPAARSPQPSTRGDAAGRSSTSSPVRAAGRPSRCRSSARAESRSALHSCRPADARSVERGAAWERSVRSRSTRHQTAGDSTCRLLLEPEKFHIPGISELTPDRFGPQTLSFITTGVHDLP